MILASNLSDSFVSVPAIEITCVDGYVQTLTALYLCVLGIQTQVFIPIQLALLATEPNLQPLYI